MKVTSLKVRKARRTTADDLPGVTGAVRLDRRTKNLTKRLRPGEIAIIDHVDLDRVAADALISRQVAAVVNAAPSISGRYPNLGPQVLIDAGIPLVDDIGQDVFAKVAEGDIVRLDGETLYADDQVIAKGTVQTAESVAAAMAEAKAGVAVQLEAFVANTMEYLRRERDLLLDGVGVPALKTKLEGRHVLVVVRGYDYREDLVVLRPYIREYRPVMLGVDGGADALLEAGYVPDIIVGDMDSVSDAALACGAELVVHAYRDGQAPGLQRVQDMGLASVVFPGGGNQRRRRAAARRRPRRQPDRRRRHPLHADRVPRQGPFRWLEHLAHPAARGQQARRAQGREPAVQEPYLRLVAACHGARRVRHPARRREHLVRRACLLRVLSRGVGCVPLLADRTLLVIDFRYHLVSIVAIFLALAIGIVIGTAALNGPVTKALQKGNASLNAALSNERAQNAALGQQVGAAGTFAQDAAPQLLAHLLDEQRVVVIEAPGSSGAVDSGVIAVLHQAGATISGQVQLQDKFFDTSATTAASMDGISQEIKPASLTLTGSTAQQRAAEVLASAIVTKTAPGVSTPPARRSWPASPAQDS